MSGGKLDSGVFQQGGARFWQWVNNLGLANATTTNANDSIKITGSDGVGLSVANYAWATLPSTVTAGRIVTGFNTADVTINLTGSHWGFDTLGDLTNQQLSVYILNDAGTIKFGVAYRSGVTLWASANSTTGNATAFNQIKVNTALGADSTALEVGWFLANFDDTGGAAENLWAVQTSIGSINIGSAPLSLSKIIDTVGAGYGGTNTKIRRIETNEKNVGADITRAISAANGNSYTINTNGQYFMAWVDANSGGSSRLGASKNSAQLTTDISSITSTDRLGFVTSVSTEYGEFTALEDFKSGDVVRPHANAGLDATTLTRFLIMRVR